jgi:hypothetical protein
MTTSMICTLLVTLFTVVHTVLIINRLEKLSDYVVMKPTTVNRLTNEMLL